MKEIIVANNSGFCFGVKRAVDMALNYPQRTSMRVRTLGPLIHNSDVIRRLEEHEIHQIGVGNLQDLTDQDAVVIRSHGVTPEIMDRISDCGSVTLDATCPFVSRIHEKVKEYHSRGYRIIIVGDKDHPEVVGIHGWCDNTAIITRDAEDLLGIELPHKICVVAQTTERQAVFDAVVEALSGQDREVLAFNTICHATQERQRSTAEVSQKVDAMIVIGGKNSSNTKKLFEISTVHCPRTVFVENSRQLPEWLWLDEGVVRIGVTAGASTPDWVIRDVVAVLQGSESRPSDSCQSD